MTELTKKTPPKHWILTEYETSYAEGRPPNLERAELPAWAKGADFLIEQGRLDLAEHAVRRLNEAYPDFPWARNLCALFDIMPSATQGQPPFADEYPNPLQVVRREGAEIAILVFCGVQHRLGMPLPMAHRWFGRVPASLVYMRDLRAMSYMAGIEGLGPDMPTSVEALREVIAELGARRVICYGNSSGGYGALAYGLELGAEAALCMSAPFNLEPAFNTHLRQIQSAQRLKAAFPDRILDLRELYKACSSPPRTYIVYGEHHWDDRLHAEHMRGLPGVSLSVVPGYEGHNTGVEMIRLGQFDALLQDAAGDLIPS
jgi:hypothetical protein